MSRIRRYRTPILLSVVLGGLVVAAVMLQTSSGRGNRESGWGTSTDLREAELVTYEMPPPSERVNRGKRSDRIPDIVLYTHEGKPVRFFEEFVQDKKVVVNFMYTVCKGICPGMTRNIKKTRAEMAAKGRNDYMFVSVSLEPETDTPEQLRNYMRTNQIENSPELSPWVFLTGKIEDIDQLRYSLGVYEKDPALDADRNNHGGIITFGNDRSDWWSATSALQSPHLMVEVVLRLTGDDSRGLPRHVTEVVPLESEEPASDGLTKACGS